MEEETAENLSINFQDEKIGKRRKKEKSVSPQRFQKKWKDKVKDKEQQREK